jgi:hypothetical protein
MSRSNGLVLFALAACAAAGTISLSRRGPTPNLPFDPNTPSSCSWWWDQNQATPCQDILDANFIALADFRRWVSRPPRWLLSEVVNEQATWDTNRPN